MDKQQETHPGCGCGGKCGSSCACAADVRAKSQPTPAGKGRNGRALCELNDNECAVIDRVAAEGPLGCRLRQMGLVAGAPVRFCKRAPLGDPIEIKLKHAHLVLRQAEAGCILVKTDEKAGVVNERQ